MKSKVFKYRIIKALFRNGTIRYQIEYRRIGIKFIFNWEKYDSIMDLFDDAQVGVYLAIKEDNSDEGIVSHEIIIPKFNNLQPKSKF